MSPSSKNHLVEILYEKKNGNEATKYVDRYTLMMMMVTVTAAVVVMVLVAMAMAMVSVNVAFCIRLMI